MSRTYALCRLLEHGALSWSELRQITGWPAMPLHTETRRAIRRGLVRRRQGSRHYVYSLA